MEGEDEIEIGQVDCSTSKTVCSKVDIHSYPTFKLFYNGEEVAKYQGNFMLFCFIYSVFTWIYMLKSCWAWWFFSLELDT